jgi:hypothetical protein
MISTIRYTRPKNCNLLKTKLTKKITYEFVPELWREIVGYVLFKKDERRATLHGEAMKHMINTITTRSIFKCYEQEDMITYTNAGPVAGAAVPAINLNGLKMLTGQIWDADGYTEAYEEDYDGTGVVLLFNNRQLDRQRGRRFLFDYIIHVARMQVKCGNIESIHEYLAEHYYDDEIDHVLRKCCSIAIDADASTIDSALDMIEGICKEKYGQ